MLPEECYIITEGVARGDYVTLQRFLEQHRTSDLNNNQFRLRFTTVHFA